MNRRLELVCLFAASLAVAGALAFVYQAKSHEFGDFERRVAHGELRDLRSIRDIEELLRPLTVVADEGERRFLAERIVAYVNRDGSSPIRNVGALAALRIEGGNRRLIPAPLLSRIKQSLVVRSPSDFSRRFVLWVTLYFLAVYTVHVFWRLRRFTGDQIILPTLHLLTGIGIVMMVSLRDPLRDYTIFVEFIQGSVGGCVLLVLLSAVDYQRLSGQLTYAPLGASLALSAALIMLGSGPGASDAKVNLGPFQPVETVKLLVTFFIAGYFARDWLLLRQLHERSWVFKRRLPLPRLEYVFPILTCVGLTLGLFFLQKDMGPALVIACLFLVMYGVVRNRAGGVVAGMLLLISGFAVGYTLEVPRTVADRIRIFLDPWNNDARGGVHVASAMWAIACGGSFGTGSGLGDPNLVPEAHTDMVLAAVGEEMGFVGILAVYAMYILLVARGFRIAERARTSYTFFLSAGLTIGFAIEILLISGGVLGLLPLSGVVSPFLSFGRSALLANFVAFAILASISAQPSGEAAKPFRRPLRRVALVLFAFVAVVLGKVTWVQLLAGDYIATRGALVLQQDGARRYEYNPRLRQLARRVGRGTIYDRNGVPLATSSWEDLERHRAEYLSLGIQLERVSARSNSRHYPLGPLTFHLLGDINSRRNWGAPNTAYLERDAAPKLRGFVGGAGAEADEETASGQHDYSGLLPLLRCCRTTLNTVPGFRPQDRDLRLSVDVAFTARVGHILEQHLRRIGRPKAAVVVLDAANGEVLAAVSEPLPRGSDASPDGELFDRARYGLYPPGSTFKLVTALAALRADPTLADFEMECVRLPDRRVGTKLGASLIRDDITDIEPHGHLRMDRAISVSCNAYFALLAREHVGASRLLGTAQELGIMVAQPNTVAVLAPMLPHAGYGQGQVLVSPFQMARVAATIASGGLIPQGHWQLDEGNMRTRPPSRLIRPEDAEVLARAMRLAVTEGTAVAAQRSSVPIAGKTGTAEVHNAPSHAWFAGFAPYGQHSGRTIAFCVLVENGRYGGAVAAPIAAEIVQAAYSLGLLRER